MKLPPDFPAQRSTVIPNKTNAVSTAQDGQDLPGEGHNFAPIQEVVDNLKTFILKLIQDREKLLKDQISKLQQENLFLQNCIEELEIIFKDELKKVKGERTRQGQERVSN